MSYIRSRHSNAHDFFAELTLEKNCSLTTESLYIEVIKNNRNPLEFKATFYTKVNEEWKSFCTSISGYVGDILEHCKQELKIYSQIS